MYGLDYMIYQWSIEIATHPHFAKGVGLPLKIDPLTISLYHGLYARVGSFRCIFHTTYAKKNSH